MSLNLPIQGKPKDNALLQIGRLQRSDKTPAIGHCFQIILIRRTQSETLGLYEVLVHDILLVEELVRLSRVLVDDLYALALHLLDELRILDALLDDGSELLNDLCRSVWRTYDTVEGQCQRRTRYQLEPLGMRCSAPLQIQRGF